MAAPQKNRGSVCSLHGDHDADKSDIILFTDDTLEKCAQILETRKHFNLKYADILLPEEINTVNGFHRSCYKKFTALSKVHRDAMDKMDLPQIHPKIQSTEKGKRVTRSDIQTPKPSQGAGIFPKVCLFCGNARKTVKRQEQRLVSVETTAFEESVRKYARWKCDDLLLARISNIDFTSKEVKYHAVCRSKYQSEARETPLALAEIEQEKQALGLEKPQTSYWQQEKDVHQKAFDALTCYVEEVIIANRVVHLLTDVNNQYQALVREIGGSDFEDAAPSTQKLEMKLTKQFGDRIVIGKGMTARGNIIYSATMQTEEALRKTQDQVTDIKVQVKNVALLLRNAIMKARHRKLPEHLTLEEVYKGEVDVPELISEFFMHLIAGPDPRSWNQASKRRRISSVSQDVIFAATSGQKKPSKHLVIGMALKSLTGSRKVVEMMNRLGHCVSYHVTEELETELTFKAKSDQQTTPYGMDLSTDGGTGTVWDNFDRFVESQNGKDTLHDTVGIAYQIAEISPATAIGTSSTTASETVTHTSTSPASSATLPVVLPSAAIGTSTMAASKTTADTSTSPSSSETLPTVSPPTSIGLPSMVSSGTSRASASAPQSATPPLATLPTAIGSPSMTASGTLQTSTSPHSSSTILHIMSPPTVEQDTTVRASTTSQGSPSFRSSSPAPLSEMSPQMKRRRAYEPTGLFIAPYRKRPKLMSSNLMPLNDPRRKRYEEMEDVKTKRKDILWMADVSNNEDIPMWVGWNAMAMPRDDRLHKIWYLPQINQSPTSNAVVVETLRRSLSIAVESGKESIAVTYDLAIAKLAMQIQCEEKPAFDNVFISLGSFHIELALFSAFGKVIEESGGPHILNECDVLAKGSVSGFTKGKNYKRCKRVHELLALAMEILHFESFLSSKGSTSDICNIIQQELATIKQQKTLHSHDYTKEMIEIFNQYEAYSRSTKNGEHGKTAQFWFQYVEMIHLYHEYSRSIRVGNFDAFISCLPKIANYFFALNHPNYARWTVKYHDNLLRMPETHPEVYAEFKKGWFSIKRTSKPFSGSPIDLTLEQTINADAASQRTGIAALTNSISARQRWAESHFLRSSVISHVFEELCMSKKEDVTASLKPHRIKGDNTAVQKILAMVKATMNPFDNELDPEHLYNIGTGKAALEKTEKFLLTVAETGNKKRRDFIDECVEDQTRFERRIQRQNLHTFASEAGRTKVKAADGRVVAACLVRDLFGSILFHSLENKIDMAEVLKFPLTPVPLSLSHVDGSMQKTPKVALMKFLESQVQTTPPEPIGTTIIDASFFLHLQMNPALPSSFGGVARFLLRRIMSSDGDTIHFVNDKWLSPSIKDCERESRDSSSVTYQITGPEQKRPSNWIQALRNSSFKRALVEFLVNSWADDDLVHIFQAKILMVTCGDVCYSYKAVDGRVVRNEESDLHCDHEEADSRMFYHLANIPGPDNVVIRTSDTDCLVIALGCCQFLDPSVKIWIESGLMSNNTQRYISVNQVCLALGETLCRALPAYHAFTGCDYTASFNRKGKVRPLKLLQKNPEAQLAFIKLGQEAEVDEDTIIILEQFVCEMYSKPKIAHVDDARLQTFIDKYQPKKGEDTISCMKKLDGSALPPCSKVLLQKIKRTHFVARRWLASTQNKEPQLSPTEYGWRESESGCYEVVWYEGDNSPTLDLVCSEDSAVGDHSEDDDTNEGSDIDEEDSDSDGESDSSSGSSDDE